MTNVETRAISNSSSIQITHRVISWNMITCTVSAAGEWCDLPLAASQRCSMRRGEGPHRAHEGTVHHQALLRQSESMCYTDCASRIGSSHTNIHATRSRDSGRHVGGMREPPACRPQCSRSSPWRPLSVPAREWPNNVEVRSTNCDIYSFAWVRWPSRHHRR